jgi:hypothetical protein
MTTPNEKELFVTQDEKKQMTIYSYYNEYSLKYEPNNLLLKNLKFLGIDYTNKIPLLLFVLESGIEIKRQITDNGVIYECVKEFDYGKYINRIKI